MNTAKELFNKHEEEIKKYIFWGEDINSKSDQVTWDFVIRNCKLYIDLKQEIIKEFEKEFEPESVDLGKKMYRNVHHMVKGDETKGEKQKKADEQKKMDEQKNYFENNLEKLKKELKKKCIQKIKDGNNVNDLVKNGKLEKNDDTDYFILNSDCLIDNDSNIDNCTIKYLGYYRRFKEEDKSSRFLVDNIGADYPLNELGIYAVTLQKTPAEKEKFKAEFEEVKQLRDYYEGYGWMIDERKRAREAMLQAQMDAVDTERSQAQIPDPYYGGGKRRTRKAKKSKKQRKTKGGKKTAKKGKKSHKKKSTRRRRRH